EAVRPVARACDPHPSPLAPVDVRVDVHEAAAVLVEELLGLVLEAGAVGTDPEAVGPRAGARDADPAPVPGLEVGRHPDEPAAVVIEQLLRLLLEGRAVGADPEAVRPVAGAGDAGRGDQERRPGRLGPDGDRVLRDALTGERGPRPV